MRTVFLSALFVVTCLLHLTAQSDTSRLSVSVRSTIYAPARKPDVERVDLRFLAAPSWEFNISYDLKRSKRIVWFCGYQRGSLPVRMKMSVPANYHPDINYQLRFPFYYTQHPYNVLSFGLRMAMNKQWVSFQLANRFYSSSHASNGVDVNLDSGQVISVFDSDTRFTRNYFCPQAVVGISGCIWSRFPSWNYEINLTLAPFAVVEGTYAFFPDDQALKTSGTFRIPQNNISVGLLYRRVKKNR